MPSLGVLHSGSADFESVDDLVEAVGELLQEVSGDSKDDAGIRAVCQRMYNTLRLYVPGQGDSWGQCPDFYRFKAIIKSCILQIF